MYELTRLGVYVWDQAVSRARTMPCPMYEMIWVDLNTTGNLTVWASLS